MGCDIWQKCKGAWAGFWQGLCGDPADLADRVQALEGQMAEIMQHLQQWPDDNNQTVVEQLHVDQITVDKIEYHNNFGSLGIKELSGMLNIGANYGTGSKPWEQKSVASKVGANGLKTKTTKKAPPAAGGPKCNIVYK